MDSVFIFLLATVARINTWSNGFHSLIWMQKICRTSNESLVQYPESAHLHGSPYGDGADHEA